MYHKSATEAKNSRKGRNISISLHMLLLLIAFLYILPSANQDELEEKPPYAVKVDFTFEESSLSKYAHEDTGVKKPQAETQPQSKPEVVKEVVPPVPEPTPTEVVQPVDPISTTTTEEDSPIKVIERPKPVIKSPDVIKPPTKPNDDVYTPPVKPSPTPTKTPSTSTGTSTTKPSTLPGNDGGTGKGDQGTGEGKTKGNDGDEGAGNSSHGTGAYDGSGDGVFGRKVIYRDTKSAMAAMTVSGIVTVKICVNRAGIVTYAEVLEAETNIRDKNTRRNFLKAARNYKVKEDYSAPEEQCGKLVFKSDASAVNKLNAK